MPTERADIKGKVRFIVRGPDGKIKRFEPTLWEKVMGKRHGKPMDVTELTARAQGEELILRRRLDDSERWELRITMVDDPHIESVDSRLHFEVPSLEQVAEELDERKYDYEWTRGLRYTDRAVVLLDPVGHRSWTNRGAQWTHWQRIRRRLLRPGLPADVRPITDAGSVQLTQEGMITGSPPTTVR